MPHRPQPAQRHRRRLSAIVLLVGLLLASGCAASGSGGPGMAPSPAPAFLTEPLSATRFRIRIVQPVQGPPEDNLMLQAAQTTLNARAEWFEIMKKDKRTIEIAVGRGEGDDLAGGTKRHDARKTLSDMQAKLHKVS